MKRDDYCKLPLVGLEELYVRGHPFVPCDCIRCRTAQLVEQALSVAVARNKKAAMAAAKMGEVAA